jgi:hypothetical protein
LVSEIVSTVTLGIFLPASKMIRGIPESKRRDLVADAKGDKYRCVYQHEKGILKCDRS